VLSCGICWAITGGGPMFEREVSREFLSVCCLMGLG